MDRLVDLDQEIDFIGKEALKKIKKEGISSILVGVELNGDPIRNAPENFWPVLDTTNKKIGRLSRCYYSPRLNRNIGLAIIDINFSEPGTSLIVESPNAHLNATVCKMPWFPAEKNKNLDS